MTRSIRIALALSLLAAAAGCDKKEEAPAAKPTASAATSAAPKTEPAKTEPAKTEPAKAEPAKVELEESKNEKMSYTIKLPKGATTQSADANGGMYMAGTMIIKVDPTGVALKGPDDLLRAVNTGDNKVEKKTEGDVFVVVSTPANGPVNIYAGPKGAKLMSHCMAEPSDKELAMKVCTSLAATKK